MKYIFLDTNIYLHYKDYEQLPWKDIISWSGEIVIVVPPIIRREIDKIKDQGKNKISNRARGIAKRFREVFINEKERSIPLKVCNSPRPSDYEEYDFDKDIQDDQFILSALLFQKDNKCDVIVVAADTNPLITAKSHGLEALYLSDEYRLKQELSREEKEFIETKKELEKYKNRLSKPTITFENGETFFKVQKPLIDPEPEIVRGINKELIEMPYIQPDNKPFNDSLVTTTSLVSSMISHTTPKPEEIQRYNNELIEYHKEYKEYMRLKINREILMKQIFELKFILSNHGNAPTGDLEIFIYFPESVNVYNSKSKRAVDLEIPPIKPEQPSTLGLSFMTKEMKKQIQAFQSQMNIGSFGYVDNRPRIWDLDKTVKHKYHFSRKSLPQKMYYGNFFEHGLYVDLVQCGNFEISYTIVDTALPDAMNGMLKFIVE